MPQTHLQNDWRELYREALLESNPATLASRVQEAHKAIQRRALELWNAGSPLTREHHDLDTAMGFLALLNKEPSSEPLSPQISGGPIPKEEI